MPKKTIKKEAPATEASTPTVPQSTDEVKIETKQVLVNKDHVYQVGEEYFPSVTTVLAALAKGKGFDVWLQGHSPDESKDILEQAGLAGSKIHHAIEKLLYGFRIIPSEFIYVDDNGVEHKGLTPEESFKISTFVRWWFEYRPKVLAVEKIIYHEEHKFAGKVDFIGTIREGMLDPKSKAPDNELMCIVDWKSGSGIYPSYEMQVAAYAVAEMHMTGKKIDRIAILRLGSRHKCGYEFRVLDDIHGPYKAFLGILDAWRYQNPNFGPKIIEVPLYFQLPKIEQVEVTTIKKKSSHNADQKLIEHPQDATAGENKAGNEERKELAPSAGSLPLSGGSSGDLRSEANEA